MTFANWLAACALACTLSAWSAEVGQAAPDFALSSRNQDNVRLSDFKDKVVYLDFWASWCAPCRKTFPWMNELQTKYGKDGLEIVAVNLDQKKRDADAFLAKVPANFKILLDPGRGVGRLYNLKGVPMSFLIDRQGIVRSIHLGVADDHWQAVETEITHALKTADQ